ncbi:flagellar basal-body rod protein FlgF [Amorphus orientalis]|uniref:Flagellar basal-body rod protein FlgF n=1 Tax=Amorphus orientalis TaxID=649198 RepID=A0AAE3VT10_9HYPH|nr:flagellar basal-body rod protein FlgF [Amorphus orientalis]MDQ0317581.1 flagellar basal-body rod protein FlgF [Amorphus orientalis]
MSSSLYVALSGQVALERRMTTVAHNVANMNTGGFRAEEVQFDTVLSKLGTREVAYSSTGDTFISRKAGPVTYTGNKLDVAIDGDGWFSIETPAGNAYTRDGRLQINEAGDLLSSSGHPILDAGGAPIAIDPAAGEVSIGRDGMISQGEQQIGALGLFLLPADARLSRYGDNAVLSDQAALPVEDRVGNSVKQGYAEGANVNPIMEMTKLIMISRAFDSAASAVERSESTEQQAIRSLGPSS